MQELSEACSTTHQNVKQIVNKLEQKGFVKTIQDTVDKRVTRIVAQAKCTKWGKKNERLAQEFLGTMFKGMSASEVSALRDSMEGIFKRMGELHGQVK